MNLKLVESEPGATSMGGRLPIVAIDGPAGAGKSTAARLLAFQIGFTLIDTGALYRTLALNAFERGVELKDGPGLAKLCNELRFQFGTLERPTHKGQVASPEDPTHIPKLHIFCNGVEVTDAIRSPELGMAASNVSKLPEVREALLQVQRDFGSHGGIVMEGRDIGTVIFPMAELKFFLTASVESRARRRCDELKGQGVEVRIEQVIVETKQRDEQDMGRAAAPLKQASDAVLIDSTSKSLEQVVTEMATLVRNWVKRE